MRLRSGRSDETTFPRRDADGFLSLSPEVSSGSTFWLLNRLCRREADAARRRSRSERSRTRNAQEFVSFRALRSSVSLMGQCILLLLMLGHPQPDLDEFADF
jgi:hypothetical protein